MPQKKLLLLGTGVFLLFVSLVISNMIKARRCSPSYIINANMLLVFGVAMIIFAIMF